MPLSRRILFSYITVSSGHQRAADAVMSAIRQLNPRVETHAVNSITYTHPIMGRLVGRMYLRMLRHAPQIWDFLYDNPTVEQATRDIREMLNILNTKNIYHLLKQFRPRCLVCTQAIPAMVMATLKERGTLKLPLVGIVTDYGVHSYWISRQVDLYIVPTDEIKRKMVRMGIKDSRVMVTGIPVDPHFSVRGDKTRERLRLGLKPFSPVVLVMGGSQGLGPLEDMVAALRKLPIGLQVMVVCGKNRGVMKDMNDRFPGDPLVHVFGHIRNIPRLMDAADLLISKPGGLTCSESLAKGLPFLMTHPIPGQEERNARFFLRHGAAERADTLEELTEKVRELLTNRRRWERLRENGAVLARPFAAYEAGEAILRLTGEPVLYRPGVWLRRNAGSAAMSAPSPGDFAAMREGGEAGESPSLAGR